MAGAAEVRLRRALGHLRPDDGAAACGSSFASAAGATGAPRGEQLFEELFAEEATERPPGATATVLSASGVGVRVDGVDAGALERRHARWLLRLLYKHRVLALSHQQHLTLPQFAEAAAHFGSPEREVWYRGTGRDRPPLVPSHPEVLCISSLGAGSYRMRSPVEQPFLDYDLAKSASRAARPRGHDAVAHGQQLRGEPRLGHDALRAPAPATRRRDFGGGHDRRVSRPAARDEGED